MKFYFPTVYIEENVSFSLPQEFFTDLSYFINENPPLPISPIEDILKTEDYSIIAIISSKSKINEVLLLGPTYIKKNKEVEFTIFIPFFRTMNLKKRMEYVLNEVLKGILLIYKKYIKNSADALMILEKIKIRLMEKYDLNSVK